MRLFLSLARRLDNPQGGEGPITGTDGVRGAPSAAGTGAEEDQLRHLIGKLVVLHGADLDEGAEVPMPPQAEGRPFSIAQAISHLLGDKLPMERTRRSVGGTAADVQRNVG